MVSRRKAPEAFTVPAGKFEGDTDSGCFEACALRETVEEAGVECEVLFDLGWYRGDAKDGSETQTHFFAMTYLQDAPEWIEDGARVRCWRTLNEAQRLVEHSESLQEAFATLRAALAARERCAEDGCDSVMEVRIRSGDSFNISEESDAMLHIMTQREDHEEASSTEAHSSKAEEGEAEAEAEARSEVRLPSKESTPDLARPDMLSNDSQGERKTLDTQDEPVRRLTGEFDRRVSEVDLTVTHLETMEGENFRFYGKQVGGHFALVKPKSQRMTVKPHGAAEGHTVELQAHDLVLKPLNKEEYSFYKELYDSDAELVLHVPRLHGTKTLTHHQVSAMADEVDQLTQAPGAANMAFLEGRMRSYEFTTYIVLEDLAASMLEPCILDLKMGYIQRSKCCSPDKRERRRNKSLGSTSHALGFRLCGMKKEDNFRNKHWGRERREDQILDDFTDFLFHSKADEEQRRRLVEQLVQRIRALRETTMNMPHWRFWSTSLLILYDGASLDSAPVIRLIDFAHCTRVTDATPDYEFIKGLLNLELCLEAVREGRRYGDWMATSLATPPDRDIGDLEEEISA